MGFIIHWRSVVAEKLRERELIISIVIIKSLGIVTKSLNAFYVFIIMGINTHQLCIVSEYICTLSVLQSQFTFVKSKAYICLPHRDNTAIPSHSPQPPIIDGALRPCCVICGRSSLPPKFTPIAEHTKYLV